ncbi:chromate efflux transporter [Anabaenopsis tanganyikae CS-531]|uniref:Chromate efflux transporter n=1 Tax=Anabaenopsis tanganyikae CS-531 TaxID=2785304 RepID=A0ABT6KC74_9CYAN|nr:chromate efflux transporter [Anabaenopsis tanganyikae]MDH6105051.1 chromate efflux transporter [Anabaenopsis tanganyikae CS-531]
MNQESNHKSIDSQPRLSARLLELAQLFLKLGLTGFGGPQAHIAMIHDESVVQRGWFTEEEFLAGVAVCEMLPGPASTQMGIYTGYLRGGILGALVAGICFILPAFVIVLILSWAYFRFQGIPQIENLFLGITPVVIAIIFGFCWKLAKRAITDYPGIAIAITVFVVTVLFPLNVLWQFLLAGMVGLVIYPPASTAWLVPLVPLMQMLPHTMAMVTSKTLTLSSFWGLERIQEYYLTLTIFFLKVGSFIFGGGLVIIPLLELEVVNQFHWLTPREFIDGVAIGEFTPGPVVITAAFIGYKVAGALGALISCVAIFTPSFLFIMGAAPLLVRIRQNPWIRSFLRGVTPAVLGAIASAAIPLAKTAIIQDTPVRSVFALIVAILALIALVRFRRPTWQLVPTGAILGLMAGAII